MMPRSPRAPVLSSLALRAMEYSASFSNSSSTPSSLNRCLYWVMAEFLGSVSTLTISSSLRSDRAVMTGRRPMSSGMMPNLIRS